MQRDKFILGYELGVDYAQLCYCLPSSQNMSAVFEKSGLGRNLIPLLAARDKKTGQWRFGIYALESKEKLEDFDFIDDLYEGFEKNKQIKLDGESYSYDEILEGFIHYSISLLGKEFEVQDISKVMITIADMKADIPEKLEDIFKSIGLLEDQIHIQDNKESFYHFMLSQHKELHHKSVMLFEYHESQKKFTSLILSINMNTKPSLVKVEAKDSFYLEKLPKEDLGLDERFRDYISKQMDKKLFSSIYLMGDIFKDTWYKSSLAFLSRRGRVFQGENLFVRGACYAAYLKHHHQEIQQTIYYGDNIVTVNVGIHARSGDKKIYYPLIVAGTNWYEAKKAFEFLIDEESVKLQLNAMDGHQKQVYEILLPQLPSRRDGSIRLSMRLFYRGPQILCVEIQDLGMGDFFPSTNKVWKEEIHLKEALYGISDL